VLGTCHYFAALVAMAVFVLPAGAAEDDVRREQEPIDADFALGIGAMIAVVG
jgi:hypothetical protein